MKLTGNALFGVINKLAMTSESGDKELSVMQEALAEALEALSSNPNALASIAKIVQKELSDDLDDIAFLDCETEIKTLSDFVESAVPTCIDTTLSIKTGISEGDQEDALANATLHSVTDEVACSLSVEPVYPEHVKTDEQAADYLQPMLIPLAKAGWKINAQVGISRECEDALENK